MTTSGLPKFLLLSFILLLFLAGLSGFKQTFSQTGISRLELIHADYSRGIVEKGIPLRILEGKVHARQDTLELFCDRAIYNESSKVLQLQGNIRMYRGKDTLLSREARYFEDSKIAVAEGEVKVFRPGQQMNSDYLEYHYDTDQIRARGNLFMHDRDNRVYITANSGEHLPDMNFSYVKDEAHFWRIDSTSTDTIHIYSRQMEYYFGEKQRAVAKDSVQIFQGEMHATCDSAVYLIDEDIVQLEIHPLAVQKNNKMIGKQIQLILDNREIREIRVSGDAQAISLVDSILEKENRLEGREIIMYIVNNDLQKIYTISNARSFYYLKEKEEDRGINVASADSIKVFLKSNELDSIAVIGGAQGTYYPQNYKGKILQE